MKVRHPDFKEAQDLNDLKQYQLEGVYDFIPNEKKEQLDRFLNCFTDFREQRGERIKDTALYENLPFSIHDNSWKSKRKDLKIIENKIKGRKNLHILDYGGWNGWLSNYLSQKGHQLVTTDLFIDEFDGLKARKYYKNNFIAIQLLPTDIWRIEATFDVVIFNRNWAYLENKEEILNHAKRLLKKDGIIIITGLAVYTFSEKINLAFKKIQEDFFKLYSIPLLIYQSKGYLETEDLKFLKKNAFKNYKYGPFKFLIKRILNRKNFNSYYSIYRKQSI